MTTTDDPRFARLLAPTRDGMTDPASFRFDPAFEAIETTIRKLERDGPTGIDWVGLARDATEVLATRSRDLAVATWLVLALAESEGLEGTALGLAVLRRMVEGEWDGLHPPPSRTRQRVGLFEWLVPRLARLLPATLTDASSGAAAVTAFEDAGALEALLAVKLPEGPVLRDLLRPLGNLADEASRAAPEPTPSELAPAVAPLPPPSPPPVIDASPAASPPPAPTPPAAGLPAAALPAIPAASDGSLEKTLAAVREAVRLAALSVLDHNLAEPRGYALLRAVTWIGIDDAPPARAGRTELLPPPASRLTEFSALREAGDNAGLLAPAERFLSGSGQFWLDGQRMVAQALGALGPRFAAALKEVAEGTAAAIRRLPTLPALQFSDGTPFADATTQFWLRSLEPSAAGAGEEGGAGADHCETAFAEATRLFGASGDVEGGLALLVEGVGRARDGRTRFRWRLAAARFASDVGQDTIALALLRDLEETASSQRIALWEPALLADVSLLTHRCLSRLAAADAPDDAAHRSALSTAFEQLARLDPLAALRLNRSTTVS